MTNMAQEHKVEAGTTPGGVDYIVQRTADARFFEVTTRVGGELPYSLSGKFTRQEHAVYAVELHLSLLKEGKDNAPRRRR